MTDRLGEHTNHSEDDSQRVGTTIRFGGTAADPRSRTQEPATAVTSLLACSTAARCNHSARGSDADDASPHKRGVSRYFRAASTRALTAIGNRSCRSSSVIRSDGEKKYIHRHGSASNSSSLSRGSLGHPARRVQIRVTRCEKRKSRRLQRCEPTGDDSRRGGISSLRSNPFITLTLSAVKQQPKTGGACRRNHRDGVRATRGKPGLVGTNEREPWPQGVLQTDDRPGRRKGVGSGNRIAQSRGSRHPGAGPGAGRLDREQAVGADSPLHRLPVDLPEVGIEPPEASQGGAEQRRRGYQGAPRRAPRHHPNA
jgi:hypothetical protein